MSEEEDWVPGSMPELLASIEHEWKLLWDIIAKLDETRLHLFAKIRHQPTDM